MNRFTCWHAMSQRIPRLSFALGITLALAAEAPLFQQDFQAAAVGKPPAEMLVLDGGFAVREDGGAKFLELPGEPLETFGALFGAAATDNVRVSARVFGTARGRRFPSFALGLGGANGYKLRVSPGKRELELHLGDADLKSVPFAWESGKWTHLRLQVRKTGDAAWVIEGKAWLEGAPEPDDWQIRAEAATAPRAGRASLWGAPYAGTPLRYDDLVIEAAR